MTYVLSVNFSENNYFEGQENGFLYIRFSSKFQGFLLIDSRSFPEIFSLFRPVKPSENERVNIYTPRNLEFSLLRKQLYSGFLEAFYEKI